ncbi:ubiquitin activating enzyme E1 [Cryptosporidium ryanae]|uniref:ubiquitin activating enzyme E1 n=1 Tax=Cryptosporidium ryanae TaxID=515981 RepID=UPI00351A1ECC|nr:ubiquitin activating enzyme E1 [Cryptosporidium ryanae]
MEYEDSNNNYWSRERLIWGKSGEELIKESKILIIGSSKLMLISELLASLSYIGINKIKLVDDQLVDNKKCDKCKTLINGKINIGNKKKRLIEDCIHNLKSNVNIEFVVKSHKEYITSLFSEDEDNNYNVIICINIPNNLVNKLIVINENKVTLKSSIINLKSYGFIGIYQVYFSESNNFFLDLSNGSRNISKLKSLQLDKPIHKLLDNSTQISFNEIDSFFCNNNSNYISKIPFPALILKFKSIIEPGNNNLNKETREQITQMLSNINEKCNYKNFVQALYYMNNVYSFNKLEYLENLITEDINNKNTDYNICSNINIKYRIILNAIYDFYEQNKRVPVSNELPDMHCDSISYLDIENIYNEQYNDDFIQVRDYIYNKYGNIVSIELIKLVCKYFFCLKIITKADYQSQSHLYNKDKSCYVINDSFRKSILNNFENLIENNNSNNNNNNQSYDKLIYCFLAIDYSSYVDFEITESGFDKFKKSFIDYIENLGLGIYFNKYNNNENDALIKW